MTKTEWQRKCVVTVPCSCCGKPRKTRLNSVLLYISKFGGLPRCMSCCRIDRTTLRIKKLIRMYPEVESWTIVPTGDGNAISVEASCSVCGEPVHISRIVSKPSKKTKLVHVPRCAQYARNPDVFDKNFQRAHRRSAKNLGISYLDVLRYLLSVVSRKERKKDGLRLRDVPEIPRYCPVFSWIRLRIRQKAKSGFRYPNSASLDRIKPAKKTGRYKKGNVCWMSLRANMIKRDASIREMKALGAYAKRS